MTQRYTGIDALFVPDRSDRRRRPHRAARSNDVGILVVMYAAEAVQP